MNSYIRQFLASDSCENVVRLFSDCHNVAKEVTESWAMLVAARKTVPDVDDAKVIVVGDGALPRTGVLFAYYTKADVVSIDPIFNLTKWEIHVDRQTKMGFPPKRIELIKAKVEDVQPIDCANKTAVVVWPHSHACMDDLKIMNAKDRWDICLPCCVPIPTRWDSIIHYTFRDKRVLSPKNVVHIWHNFPEDI